MPAYVVSLIRITDPEQYARYTAIAGPAMAKYGGRFIIRGGSPQVLEGPPGINRTVVAEFESVEAARRFYDSPEYRQARATREGAAEFSMVVAEGL